jgi:hypothetical protein
MRRFGLEGTGPERILACVWIVGMNAIGVHVAMEFRASKATTSAV